MSTRTNRTVDFLRILNEQLKENEFWSTLMEKTTKVMQDVVHEQTTQLARSRGSQHLHRGDYLTTPHGRGRVVHVDRKYDTNNLLLDEVSVHIPNIGNVVVPFRSIQDRGILVNGARFMGFDYFSSNLTDEDYARIYRYIGEYWDDSGGVNFVNFIGFIKNMRFEIHQLWTRDAGDFALSDDEVISKYPFLEANEGLEVIGFGPIKPIYKSNTKWNLNAQTETDNRDYPTAHVELSYNLEFISRMLTADDVNDIVCLFYFLAPIHLVLERLTAEIRVDFKSYSNRGRSPQVHQYDQGFYHWNASKEFNVKMALGFQLHAYDSATLYLDDDDA